MTTATATRHADGWYRTTRPTVIPFVQGARHIDALNGKTVCGFTISEDNYRFAADPDGARISCNYCMTDRPYPHSRQPRWIRRMNEGKLPNKDLTGKGPDAA